MYVIFFPHYGVFPSHSFIKQIFSEFTDEAAMTPGTKKCRSLRQISPEFKVLNLQQGV